MSFMERVTGSPHLIEEARKDYIRRVRNAGECLIKNAESIVGTEKYLRTIDITINIDFGGMDIIEVNKKFCPEGTIESEQ